MAQYFATQRLDVAQVKAMIDADRTQRATAIAVYAKVNKRPIYVVCPVVVAKKKRYDILDTYI